MTINYIYLAAVFEAIFLIFIFKSCTFVGIFLHTFFSLYYKFKSKCVFFFPTLVSC